MKKATTKHKRGKQKFNLNSRFVKWFVIISIFTVFSFIFLNGPRGLIRYYKVDKEKEQLERDIKTLKQEKSELDSEKVKLNDDAYIEKIARESYNMKKSGEKVYKIKKDEK